MRASVVRGPIMRLGLVARLIKKHGGRGQRCPACERPIARGEATEMYRGMRCHRRCVRYVR